MGAESMFAGFNVTIEGTTILEDFYFAKGRQISDSYGKAVKKSLEKYICNEKSINGSLMQEDWFPEVKTDIFLSHSRKNEKMIISLAGWLYEVFGLKSFVDSSIWGYSDDLLKIIDDEYCLQKKENFKTIYNYEKRNYSTSHVNMMLSMALTKMIDNTECLFFINTPESISVSETMDEYNTLSPWIYAELQTSRLIRHKDLQEYRPAKYFDKDAVDVMNLQIKYNVKLDHLTNINNNDLLYWMKNGGKNMCEYPLDVLYDYKNLLSKDQKVNY